MKWVNRIPSAGTGSLDITDLLLGLARGQDYRSELAVFLSRTASALVEILNR